MDKQKKSWGFTQEILKHNNVSIHRIEINKGHSCSKHYHEFKYNTFYVENGSIKIQQWDNTNNICEIILYSGQIHNIPPKKYHKFIGLEDSIVYEIYYVELGDQDIVRIID